MKKTDEGGKILHGLKSIATRIVPARTTPYEGIREMMRTLHKIGGM